MFNFLVDFLFPSRCFGCGLVVKTHAAVCEKCFNNIPVNQTLFCGQCFLRLADNKKICHLDFPYLLGAASDYKNETVRNLIWGLKFKSIKRASAPLGKILVDYAQKIPCDWQKFTVMPIPLSKQRNRERGFNQSQLLAQFFTDSFKLNLDSENLIRFKNTFPQSEIKSFEKRKDNIRGCFAVKNPESIRGKNVILIDDVTTSGATLFEAANTLKKCGVKKIIAMVAAKA